MSPILSLHTWVSLSAEMRNRIRVLFSIPRSGNVIVSDGRIETDGTTPEDFKALSIEKMQSFTEDTTTDFHKLFDKTLEKIQGNIEEGLPSSFPVKQDVIPKTNAKPKKNK